MVPSTQPIFCLEDFELVNPPRSMEENFSTPYFHITVKTKDEEKVAAVMFEAIVKACQVHAPAEANYIEKLHWYVLNGGRADFMLLQAMEEEGFEVERLMRIYLENEPWWERLRKEGLDNESLRLHAIQYPESKLPEIAKMLFGFIVNPTLETTSALAIANAFQEEVWKTFPEMEGLHQKELAEFIENASHLAKSYLTDVAAAYEDNLESDSKQVEDPFGEKFNHSLEGIQKRILESRQHGKVKPNNPSPITVEILEIQYDCIHDVRNEVTIWYKATCKEGVFYDYTMFKDLLEEAALHFPEWYYKIEALWDSIVAVRPREKEIVESLLAEHFDFIPLLASYVNGWVDAAECLEFEQSIKKRNHYENNYDMHLKSFREFGPGLEQARKINLLTDRLEDIAYDMVCEAYPSLGKAAKAWMKRSLRQSAHLLVFELMDAVWGLISLCEKKAV